MILSKASSLRMPVGLFLWLFTSVASYGANFENNPYGYLLGQDEGAGKSEEEEAKPESDTIGNCREEIGSIKFSLIKTPSHAAGKDTSDKLLPPYKALNKAFKKIIVTIHPQDQAIQDLLKMKKTVTYEEDRKINKVLKKININISSNSKISPFFYKRTSSKYETFIMDRKQKDIKQISLYDLLKHIIFISYDYDPVTVQRCPAELILLIDLEIKEYLRSNIEEIQDSGIDTILEEVLGEVYYAYFESKKARLVYEEHLKNVREDYRDYLEKVCEENLTKFEYYDDSKSAPSYQEGFLVSDDPQNFKNKYHAVKSPQIPDEQEEVGATPDAQTPSNTLLIGCLVAAAAAGGGSYFYSKYKKTPSAPLKEEALPNGRVEKIKKSTI